MKRIALVLSLIMLLQNASIAASIFSENNKFGLENENGEIIFPAKYKKLIKLGEESYLMQSGSKFGIIRNDGTVLVEPKYNYAERVLGKYAKLTKGSKTGLFNSSGEEILPVEFTVIDLLYGGLFLTCRNYKYGVYDMKGNVVLDNVFDDIYMPKPSQMIIVYNSQAYEIERVRGEGFSLPDNIVEILDDDNYKISEIISKPVVATGYYGVSATNYLLKVISSVSPAYEETIDELMFSKGADSVFVLMRCSWIPKFPFVYAKKYYQNLIAPNNGVLSGLKTNLKQKL